MCARWAGNILIHLSIRGNREALAAAGIIVLDELLQFYLLDPCTAIVVNAGVKQGRSPEPVSGGLKVLVVLQCLGDATGREDRVKLPSLIEDRSGILDIILNTLTMCLSSKLCMYDFSTLLSETCFRI